MKIGLDLDGTLYDTLESIFSLDQQVRVEFGYAPVSKREYKRLFQTENWYRLCKDLGIRDEDIDEYMEELGEMIQTLEPPHLIPGGKEAIKKVEKKVGLEKIYIITNNRNPGEIKRRFERDGLAYLFRRVSHPYEGKAEALFDAANEDPGSEFVYVGDLVSDGRACRQARAKGASNIKFCAITHEYAMNPPEALNDFVDGHDFALSIASIHEIEWIWKDTKF